MSLKTSSLKTNFEKQYLREQKLLTKVINNFSVKEFHFVIFSLVEEFWKNALNFSLESKTKVFVAVFVETNVNMERDIVREIAKFTKIADLQTSVF